MKLPALQLWYFTKSLAELKSAEANRQWIARYCDVSSEAKHNKYLAKEEGG